MQTAKNKMAFSSGSPADGTRAASSPGDLGMSRVAAQKLRYTSCDRSGKRWPPRVTLEGPQGPDQSWREAAGPPELRPRQAPPGPRPPGALFRRPEGGPLPWGQKLPQSFPGAPVGKRWLRKAQFHRVIQRGSTSNCYTPESGLVSASCRRLRVGPTPAESSCRKNPRSVR